MHTSTSHRMKYVTISHHQGLPEMDYFCRKKQVNRTVWNRHTYMYTHAINKSFFFGKKLSFMDKSNLTEINKSLILDIMLSN